SIVIPSLNNLRGDSLDTPGPDATSADMILKSHMPFEFETGSYGMSIASVLDLPFDVICVKFAGAMYLSGWCMPIQTLKLASFPSYPLESINSLGSVITNCSP